MDSSKIHPTNCNISVLIRVNNKEDCKCGNFVKNVPLPQYFQIVCGEAVYKVYNLQIKGMRCALVLFRQLSMEKMK